MQALYKTTRGIIAMSIILPVLITSSCKKLVDIPPPTDQIVDNNVFTNDETVTAVLTGIYTSMGYDGYFTGQQSMTLRAGLSADELTLNSGVTNFAYPSYYANALSTNNGTGSEFWSPLYNYIYKCNAAIEGLTASNILTPSVKQQLLGEAKFLRAFYYFYLVNLFGDVPLALTTDYKLNTLLVRTPKTQVYQQIVTDLKEAQDQLTEAYLDGRLQPYGETPERVRPSKWAATALLARVYLYTSDYANAEAAATSVINQSSLYSLPYLQDAFKNNSTEAIWQLQPVMIGHNTEDAWTFIIPSTGPNQEHPVYLSNQLLNSFESGDVRKSEWVGNVTVSGSTYYYSFKYQSAFLDAPLTEYLMVLRLGEQLLIRAEARAHLNNLNGAQDDLNVIRARAGLPNTTATDQASLVTAIQHERRVELFTEWGHRWLDLKRNGTVDAVMSVVTPLKANGAHWQSYQQLYPLSLDDIQHAPNLVQNTGY